jgi:hypothetical protein
MATFSPLLYFYGTKRRAKIIERRDSETSGLEKSYWQLYFLGDFE